MKALVGILLLALLAAPGLALSEQAERWAPRGPYIVGVYVPGEGYVQDPAQVVAFKEAQQLRSGASDIDLSNAPASWRRPFSEVRASCRANLWYNAYQNRWVCYGNRGRHR